MERQEALNAELIRREDIGGLVKQYAPWATLAREAEQLKAAIAAGRYEWPPKERDTPYHRYGRWVDPADYGFDLHVTTAFAHLPSVVRHSGMVVRLAELLRVDRNVLATQELHMYYHTVLWRRYGRKIYALGEDTWDLLAQTELPDQLAQYLDAPHQSFFLKFPDGAFNFAVELDRRPQPCEGVVITFNEVVGSPERSREMSLLIVGRSDQGSEDDNIAFATIGLGPDALVSEVTLEGYNSRFSSVVGSEEISLVLPRVVMGFLLYMQQAHPHLEPVLPAQRVPTQQIKNSAKRRRAEQRNARLSRYGYVYVARPDVEFSYATPGEAPKVRRSPSAPFWVRRHPHKYRVGAGRTQVIERMVGPYIKCEAADAESQARVLRVQPARRVTKDD